MLPFRPSATAPVNHAVTSTTSSVALPGNGNVIRVALEGTTDVHVKLGASDVTAADTDLLVKGGQKEVYLHRRVGDTHIAFKTASGTNTANVATGEAGRN